MPRPVMLCYGTRPQVIKASVLRDALSVDHRVVAVDTGQHYDYTLNQLLYDQLGVDQPDRTLEVGSAGHAEQTALILQRSADVILEYTPALVLVIGDTNSTLGCALAAAKLRIPVAHVEAGLRAKDTHMAEEINRRVVDAFADLLFTPSAAATARLRRERADALVVESGDVARDVLERQRALLPAPHSAAPAAADVYVYATLHRAELTDHPAMFFRVLDALDALPYPVVLPLHPRTRAALDRAAPDREWTGALQLGSAVGYHESLTLCRDAALVITDSGGVQREAYWLGTPCITMRAETEWSETVEEGANVVLDPAAALTQLPGLVEEQRRRRRAGWNRDHYGKGKAGEIIAAEVRRFLETSGVS